MCICLNVCKLEHFSLSTAKIRTEGVFYRGEEKTAENGVKTGGISDAFVFPTSCFNKCV